MSESGLPRGWNIIELGELARPLRLRVKPVDHPDLPFIGMQHIEAHTMRLLGTVPASRMKSSVVHFQPGDVLYGRLRPYLNKVYRPHFEGLSSAEFIVLSPSERLHGAYLQYFLNSAPFVRYASHLNTGDRPRVDFEQLASYPVPVAPPDEQDAIIGEIEKQFTRLDAAVAALGRARANLRAYRNSVLREAVIGRLLSPNAELDHAMGGVSGESSRPQLPSDWQWTTLGSLCPVFVDCVHRTPKAATDGFPALRPRDVVAGILRTHDAMEVTEEEFLERTARREPTEGDVIYSRELSYGWAVVVPADMRLCLGQGMTLFRPDERMDPNFLALVLNSPFGRRQARRAATGTAHPHINLREIKTFMIPIPPASRQKEILGEVDRRLSIILELEQELSNALKRADRMRQAILDKGFAGELTGGRLPASA